MGGGALLWLIAAALRDGGTGGPLGLLGVTVILAYGGLWLLLRSEIPPQHLRGLGMGLLAVVVAVYGVGLPAWALLAGLWVLALLLVARSGPVLLIAWIERTDRKAQAPR